MAQNIVEPQRLTGNLQLAELLAEYKRAERETKDFHENVKRWRNWYNFEHYKRDPLPGEERYTDPTPTNVVDTAVGIMLSRGVRWVASGFEPYATETETASKIEKYIAGTLEANNIREEMDVLAMVATYFIRDGMGIIYSPFDPVLAEDLATQIMIPAPDGENVVIVEGFMETPMRVQAIDPLNIFLLPGGPQRWGTVFRKERMTVYDVEKLYGVQLNNWKHLTEERKMTQYGDLIDVWRWVRKPMVEAGQMPLEGFEGEISLRDKWVVQHAVIFEKEWIYPLEDTDYPDIPYTIGFFKPVDPGSTKNWSHSIISPLEHTTTFVEKAINRRQRQITMLTSLPLVARLMQGRSIAVDSSIAEIVELHPDENLEFPRWPGNPPDVEQQLQFFQRRQAQAGFSEPDLTGGAASGYALSQIADANKIKLQQPIRQFEFMLTNWARKLLRLTAKMAAGKAIHVYGSMRGKSFTDQIVAQDFATYLVRAKLEPEFPGEEVRKSAIATQATGKMSLETIMQRYYNIQQPDDEIKRMIREQAKMHPMVIEYGIRKCLMELADEGDEAAIMTLMAMEQGAGRQGGGSAPGQQPLTGVMSATGEPTPQEQGRRPPGQNEEEVVGSLANIAPGLE